MHCANDRQTNNRISWHLDISNTTFYLKKTIIHIFQQSIKITKSQQSPQTSGLVSTLTRSIWFGGLVRELPLFQGNLGEIQSIAIRRQHVALPGWSQATGRCQAARFNSDPWAAGAAARGCLATAWWQQVAGGSWVGIGLGWDGVLFLDSWGL